MKILIILGLAGVGAWYLLGKAKESKVVAQTQEKAEKYTSTLQNDMKKAEAAADAANKAIKKSAAEVEKALPQ